MGWLAAIQWAAWSDDLTHLRQRARICEILGFVDPHPCRCIICVLDP